MEEIKNQLQTKVERRAHPRFPADFPVLAYPYYTDGEVGPPIAGQCRDISEGGIRIASPVPIRASQIYVEFKDLDDVAGSAVLVQITRTGQDSGGEEFITVGRFRASARSGGWARKALHSPFWHVADATVRETAHLI